MDNEICLELSFKEREPNDRQVIPQIAESIAFWAPHIDTGAEKLKVDAGTRSRSGSESHDVDETNR